MESILLDHCKKISNFSKNPKLDNISVVIKAISDLCQHKSIVSIQLDGYIKCFICKLINDQCVPIMCGHVVHRDCLEKKCKILSKNTFDPEMLMVLHCECKKMISQEEYTNIIGRRIIQACQNKVNAQLQEKIRMQEKKARKQEIEKMTFQCPTCLNDTKVSEAITMSCDGNHRFCHECTEQMIKQQIKDGKYQMNAIVCQYDKCNQPLDQILIKTYLSPEQYHKYINIQTKHLKIQGLQIRQCGGYIYQDNTRLVEFDDRMDQKKYAAAQQQLERKCKAIQNGQIQGAKLTKKFKKCEMNISYDPKQNHEGGFLKCWQCLLQSCIKGCNSAHRGNTCQKYKQWQATNQKSKQISLQQILALGMAQCQNPACMRIILKNQGCDHVTCTCGFQICYRCSRPYTVCRAACPPRR